MMDDETRGSNAPACNGESIHAMRRPAAFLSFVFAAMALQTAQAQFIESAVSFDAPVSSIIDARGFRGSDSVLALTGRTESETSLLSIYRLQPDNRLESSPLLQMELPERLLFMDTGRIGEQTEFLFVERDGVSKLDMMTGTTQELVSIASMYRGDSTDRIGVLDFSRDINGDGLDDIVLPDFDGIRIALQEEGGFRVLDLLELPVRMTIEGVDATYIHDELHWYDFNSDSRLDLAVVRDRSFLVFAAKADGGFEPRPAVLPINIDLAEDSQADAMESMFSADQSDLQVSGITDIADLNKDGLPDIVSFTVISSGVFDKSSEYRVYLARRQGDTIAFAAEPDAVIESSGLQIGLSQVETAVDGVLDLVVTSVDFGLRQIIAALLTRSVSLDISLHKFAEAAVYSSMPDFQSDVRISVNVSTGYISNPAVRFGDFDGDGLADFLVQEDHEELSIRRGQPGGQTFDDDAIIWTSQLPIDGTGITVSDLNGDNRDDLIVSYGNGDSEDSQHMLRALISTLQ